MINAIALDDEPLALDILKEFCSRLNTITLSKSFIRVSDAEKYLSKFPVDLIFLDINMPSKSGIDFYRALDQKPFVIFTTAYEEFAIAGFELNAIDYLVKPFAFERFETAVQKAIEMHHFKSKNPVQKEPYFYVRSDYSLHQIPLNEITIIESFADYIDIHYGDKKVTTRMPLKNFLEKLPQQDFVRVHRSYIIAINKIEKFNKKSIFIMDREIPIGNSYEEDFNNRIKR